MAHGASIARARLQRRKRWATSRNRERAARRFRASTSPGASSSAAHEGNTEDRRQRLFGVSNIRFHRSMLGLTANPSRRSATVICDFHICFSGGAIIHHRCCSPTENYFCCARSSNGPPVCHLCCWATAIYVSAVVPNDRAFAVFARRPRFAFSVLVHRNETNICRLPHSRKPCKVSCRSLEIYRSPSRTARGLFLRENIFGARVRHAALARRTGRPRGRRRRASKRRRRRQVRPLVLRQRSGSLDRGIVSYEPQYHFLVCSNSPI